MIKIIILLSTYLLIKPDSIETKLYCDTCINVVKLIQNRLNGSRKEYDIDYAMENLCVYDNLNKADHIPPKMVKTCNSFRDLEATNIKNTFLSNKFTEELDLCYKIKGICIEYSEIHKSLIESQVREKIEDL